MKKSNAWNRQRKSEPIKNSGMDFVNKQNSGHESTTGSTTVPKPLFRHSMKAFSLAPNNRLNKLGNGPISRVK